MPLKLQGHVRKSDVCDMPHYYIWTIGCQMNKADSAQISTYLEQRGFLPAQTPEEADFLVLNSCVVRYSAENRVLSQLGYLKGVKKTHPHMTIALTGCLVDSKMAELKQSFPQVDLFFKPQDWQELAGWLDTQGLPPVTGEFAGNSEVSAFVPIIKGCDNFCSYCIVPYRRGKEQSRPVEEIRCEVEALVRQGAREVTLLGQNVNSYGHDLPSKPDLSDLLDELNKVEGLWRIRFLTSHPKDMTTKLINAMSRLDKVCKYLSLPIQSGDDEILKAMRRSYSVAEYRSLIQQIRSTIPGLGLSTDVIVGFPGESQEQFEHTLQLLSELRFDTVHVAAYSPRPGTAAARLEDNVPPQAKAECLQQVESLQQSIARQINAQLLGQEVEILVERQSKGKWQGRTRSGKLVFFSGEGDWRGKLAWVRIDNTSPWALQGEVSHS